MGIRENLTLCTIILLVFECYLFTCCVYTSCRPMYSIRAVRNPNKLCTLCHNIRVMCCVQFKDKKKR